MLVSLKVNGKAASVDVPPNTLLVTALREHLRLTGTHVGCDTAQCGACTVLVNGRAIKSCNTLAAQHPGAEITTIEGLAEADGALHPMQAAFKECHGLQCGFCTPGMVMSALDLCKNYPSQRGQIANSSKATSALYPPLNIVKAVQQARLPWPASPEEHHGCQRELRESGTSARPCAARRTTAS
jgi:carbon-monoxide dehydrogenase small subunit